MNQQEPSLREDQLRRFLDSREGRKLMIDVLAPRARFVTLDLDDHVLTVSTADYIGRSVFTKGHFDRDHVDRLLGILSDRDIDVTGKTLLELGGNIGTHTVYFGLAGVFGRIVTVEPDPRNYPLLLRNIADNGLARLVTPVHCAAGEAGGEIDFYLHPTNHGRSSPVPRNGTDERVRVAVRTVPEILAEAGVEAADIGLVWMDIEGYEPVAMRGMQVIFAARVPVYFEYSPAFYGAEAAHALVAMLAGYYDRCLLFHEDVVTASSVCDIPVDDRQFDILLLP